MENFSIILQEYIRLSTEVLNPLAQRLRKEADKLSMYSDSPRPLTLSIPQGSLLEMCYDLLSLAWILPYQSEDLREVDVRTHYYNYVLRNNLEDHKYGKLIMQLAKSKFTINELLKIFVETVGTEAFFGNLINYYRKKERIRRIRMKVSPAYKEQSGKVRKSQRKRGYTDKGSLPSFTQWCRRIIAAEEAKEAPERKKKELIDFIPPRRWKRGRKS